VLQWDAQGWNRNPRSCFPGTLLPRSRPRANSFHGGQPLLGVAFAFRQPGWLGRSVALIQRPRCKSRTLFSFYTSTHGPPYGLPRLPRFSNTVSTIQVAARHLQ